MADGLLWFLLHLQHPHILVNGNDTRSLQTAHLWFIMAHDDRCALLLEIVNESLERKLEDVVGCNDQDVIVDESRAVAVGVAC